MVVSFGWRMFARSRRVKIPNRVIARESFSSEGFSGEGFSRGFIVIFRGKDLLMLVRVFFMLLEEDIECMDLKPSSSNVDEGDIVFGLSPGTGIRVVRGINSKGFSYSGETFSNGNECVQYVSFDDVNSLNLRVDFMRIDFQGSLYLVASNLRKNGYGFCKSHMHLQFE
jgi:hypothetical protein|tara:strand:- start:319 stop:825 length:507 start_codon:yes stop_codon:yes gene_type:complete